VCKKSIKISQPFVNKMKNVMTPQGGFFDSHCRLGTCCALCLLFAYCMFLLLMYCMCSFSTLILLVGSF